MDFLHPFSLWGWAGGLGCSPTLRLSFLSLPAPFPYSPPPPPPSPRLPNPAAVAAAGQNKHGGRDRGAAAGGAHPGLSEAGGGQGQPPSQGLGGRGAFWGHPGHWDEGLHQQGPQSDQSPGLCCFPAACRGPTDSLRPLLPLPGQVPPTPDPPSHPPERDPQSVTSPPSVLMNLGRGFRAQASTLFWDRLKEPRPSFCSWCKSCGCWAWITWWPRGREKPRGRLTSYQTQL
ncbi:PREDICTED: circumsporozoite protein-like [Ceratotherium simum simum]|uniref:Circumsporozoite protein-like n=1 Tax=Ceratotherium simum simum TaxID=73337 RepID=A0ABM1D2Q4_CERSS|nr:PREDICTED: circumsporozoite protein-like [Ceratotherium simum simum]